MDVAGEPMLVQQIRRIKRCRRLDEIVLATTLNDDDRPLVAVAESEGIRWFRGSEHDVLSRYLGAAREAKADIVVRMTSDCPLMDPEVADRTVEALAKPGMPVDYASNIQPRTYPRGLDVEALFMDVLERTARLATTDAAREHVTYFIHSERPDLFVLRSVEDVEDHSDLRWTVDTLDDLALARAIYQDLNLGASWVTYRDLIRHVRSHANLLSINAHIVQKHA